MTPKPKTRLILYQLQVFSWKLYAHARRLLCAETQLAAALVSATERELRAAGKPLHTFAVEVAGMRWVFPLRRGQVGF